MDFLTTVTDSLRPHLSMKTWEWEEFFDDFEEEKDAISWVSFDRLYTVIAIMLQFVCEILICYP